MGQRDHGVTGVVNEVGQVCVARVGDGAYGRLVVDVKSDSLEMGVQGCRVLDYTACSVQLCVEFGHIPWEA